MTLVPPLEEPRGVVLPPSPRVAQRAAGVPLLAPAVAPQALDGTADYSTTGQSDQRAFWLIGRDLFQANANQILRDVRSELQIPTETPFIYPVGIFERMATAARRRNPGVTLPPLPETDFQATFSDDWMKVLLWLTYSDAPVRLADVRLPTQTVLPETGEAAWVPPGPAASSSVRVMRGFDASLLARNPFSTYLAPDINIEGDPPREQTDSSSSGGGLLLVGVGLAALLLLGGKK